MDTIDKKYYAIGEIAKELNIKTSSIRFWLSELEISIERRENGNRQFTTKERELVHKIYKLRSMGLDMYGVKEFLNDPQEFIYELIYLKQ